VKTTSWRLVVLVFVYELVEIALTVCHQTQCHNRKHGLDASRQIDPVYSHGIEMWIERVFVNKKIVMSNQNNFQRRGAKKNERTQSTSSRQRDETEQSYKSESKEKQTSRQVKRQARLLFLSATAPFVCPNSNTGLSGTSSLWRQAVDHELSRRRSSVVVGWLAGKDGVSS
jgi:hypothetical protein